MTEHVRRCDPLRRRDAVLDGTFPFVADEDANEADTPATEEDNPETDAWTLLASAVASEKNCFLHPTEIGAGVAFHYTCHADKIETHGTLQGHLQARVSCCP